MPTPTKLPLLSLNCRGEPIQEDIEAGRGWTERRDHFIDLVRTSGAWAFTAQECSLSIRADLLEALGGGDAWGYWANGNVMVWGRKSRLQRIAANDDLILPSPDNGIIRRLVVVRFRVYNPDDSTWKITGSTIDVASAHFTVGDPYWQNLQMQAVIDELRTHWNIRNAVFGADLNNSNVTGECPRTIGTRNGFIELWNKAGRDVISNDLANTWNGWRETVYGDQRIDGVFFGANLMPYYGKVIDTNGASDHNWIRASAVQLSDET